MPFTLPVPTATTETNVSDTVTNALTNTPTAATHTTDGDAVSNVTVTTNESPTLTNMLSIPVTPTMPKATTTEGNILLTPSRPK